MEAYENKQSINDFWVSVMDKLPDKEDHYLCTVRMELYDKTGKLEYAFSRLRWTYFSGGRFKLPDPTGGENKQYVQFVTDWMENPVPVTRGDKASCKEEYEFATDTGQN